MSQVNTGDRRIAIMTSSQADEAVVKIKHDYEGDCSRDNAEFIEHLSLMLGTEIDSSSLLEARDGFASIRIDRSSLSAVEKNTLSATSDEDVEKIMIISQFVPSKQEAIHDPKRESLLSIEALQLVQETFKKLVSDQQKVIDSSEFEASASILEKNNTDRVKQRSWKTIESMHEKTLIKLHEMNEKMLSSIDSHQNQTKRNRQEIKHLDDEIAQVLESINN